MEDIIFPRTQVFQALADSPLDFELMEDLLSGGFWLETTDGSDFMLANASTSTLFDSSSLCPSSDLKNSSLSASPLQNTVKDDKETKLLSDNQSADTTQSRSLLGVQPLQRSTTSPEEGDGKSGITTVSAASRRWWLESPMNPNWPSVEERLVRAISHIKDIAKDGDALLQVWVPVSRGGRNILTTLGQPFWHGPNCQQLLNYRTLSTKYEFAAEESSNVAAGLPGRVFIGRVPEWTPDVRFFTKEEYPRVSDALRNGVHGTIALPIFERGSRVCLGVLEVVLTTRRIKYGAELESICNALQAVNLTTSEVSTVPRPKVFNNSYQVVLPEILELLRAVCETQRLPLAQTWIPCIQQDKSSSHSEENYVNCISTVDGACYVTDPRVWSFYEACSEHHLLKGQGVAGKAFTTNQPCFSSDIRAFTKAEYPLSHYAKMFSLRAAVAIRLRSIHSAGSDYVLELFLPAECRDREEQKVLLNSLSVVMQQVCRSLRVVTDEELLNESVLSVNDIVPRDRISVKPTGSKDERTGGDITTYQMEASLEQPLWGPSIRQTQQEENSIKTSASMPLKIKQQEPLGFNFVAHNDQHRGAFSQFKQHDQHAVKLEHGDTPLGENAGPSGGGGVEKRRTKIEKHISLDVLRQYFAGNLKDAAKSIGVCPTTLKRICRQHGITRWPSRKIKKVGHSLRKLQVVIDSVQGVEGAFKLDTLYPSFSAAYGSDIMSSNLSGTTAISALNQMKQSVALDASQTQGTFNTAPCAIKSPSSVSSQSSSSSSLCCSSGDQNDNQTGPHVENDGTPMKGNQSRVLKRAYSEAELDTLIKEEPKPPPRSLSFKSLTEHPAVESFVPLLTSRKPDVQQPGCPRVKVSYGQENVRFSLHPSWRFQDLIQEVGKRFRIEDMDIMSLKYLDDDSEWVLLTCDDDLGECQDIHRSSGSRTIKLSLHHKHLSVKSSFNSSGALS